MDNFELILQLPIGEKIPHLRSYDIDKLFLFLLRKSRYDLIQTKDFNVVFDDKKLFNELLEALFDDEQYYYLEKINFSFPKELEDKIIDGFGFDFNFNDNKFANFILWLKSIGRYDSYIDSNINILKDKILNTKFTTNATGEFFNDNRIIKIFIENNLTKHLSFNEVKFWSLDNIKLFASKKGGPSISNDANNIIKIAFLQIDNLDSEEFINLLYYGDGATYGKDDYIKDYLDDNFDKIINHLDGIERIPVCLLKSSNFRDKCIAIQRYDIAVKCVLPEELIDNDELMMNYCRELEISKEDLLAKYKNLYNYFNTKNKDIFKQMLGTSLKSGICQLDDIHYERIINDHYIQRELALLDSKSLKVITTIANRFNYNEYDVSNMIANMIVNIKNYKSLVESIDIELLNDSEIRNLINILQFNDNYCDINNKDDISNYKKKKSQSFILSISSGNFDEIKEKLLRHLFNISGKEARRINNMFCYNSSGECILESIFNQIPKNIYDILNSINIIVNTNNIIELLRYSKIAPLFDCTYPLETYLRGEYAKLYSETLYSPTGKDEVQSIDYNGNKVKVFVPNENSNILIHVVGTCSIVDDKANNYKGEWEDYPQILDHVLACSIMSMDDVKLRSNNNIVYGFNSFESAALYYMDTGDIDSLNDAAVKYDTTNNLEIGKRVHIFPPKYMTENTNGYNEIVMDRRSIDDKKFKKSPDYIIVNYDSRNDTDLKDLDYIFNNKLYFLSEEDKLRIKTTPPANINSNLIKYSICNEKYKDKILELYPSLRNANYNEILKFFYNMILKAVVFEESVKAASDFDIPIVAIDKAKFDIKAADLVSQQETSKTTDSEQKK